MAGRLPPEPSLPGAALRAARDVVVGAGLRFIATFVATLGLLAIVIIAIPVGIVVLFGVMAAGWLLASFIGFTNPVGMAVFYASGLGALVAVFLVFRAMYRKLEPLGRRAGVVEEPADVEPEVPILSAAERRAADAAFRARVGALDAGLAAPGRRGHPNGDLGDEADPVEADPTGPIVTPRRT